MYRLLKVGGASVRNYSPLSLRNIYENCDYQNVVRNCVYCNGTQPHSYTYIRTSSSSANSHLMSVTKEKRKKNKKVYKSDILVVSEKSSKVEKASVQNLTPEDLNILVNTDLNLNELYKLKQKSSPKLIDNPHIQQLTDFSEHLGEAPVIVTPRLDGINLEEFDHGSIKSVLERPAVEAIHDEDKDISTSSVAASAASMKLFQEQLHAGHHELVNETTLSAFIEICNHLKNPVRGLRAFYNFHSINRRHTRLTSPKVYCLLLKGFAHKGDYKKLQEILKLMSDEGIIKDIHCYGAIFECLSRIHNTPESRTTLLTEITPYINDCQSQNITLNDIMTRVQFTNEERQLVLDAIRCYNSDFEPEFTLPYMQYKNHLVDVLNHESQLKKLQEIDGDVDNGGIFTVEKLRKSVDQQVKMETGGFVEVKSVETKGAPSKDVLTYRTTLEDHYKMWEATALAAFQRDLASLTAQKHFAVHLEPYLRCIPQREFVNIMVAEAKRLGHGSETYSPTAAILRTNIGYKVFMRYRTYRQMNNGVMDKVLNIHKTYCDHYAHIHPQLDHLPTEKVYMNPRQQWQWIEHGQRHTGSSLHIGSAPWAPTTIQEIGKFLYRIMMHDLKVDVNALRPNEKIKNYLPAFYTIFRNQNRSIQEEIKPHPVLSRIYRASQPVTLSFPAHEMPMLCPPIPWISTELGGYLLCHSDVVRVVPQALLQKQRLKQQDPAKLYPNFDALNQLSSVPWTVNKKVLEIILEVFRDGGSAKLDVPEHPATLQQPPSPTEDMDKSEKYQLYKKKLQYRRKKGEMHSLWCDCLYRLSLANHFKDKVFWLPHNMDFRGRVYPIPPHLSHLGSDLARSMLVFAEPRPLGPNGLDWLKIHLVNLTGLKKREPVKERLKFANEIMDRILDSANKPLTGKRWWADSDEPWQTLACCMEIAAAIRSGDTVNYRSHFPIHQDGSCNGLQHYAALGRDSAGAYSVNLTPADVPQDVYSAVVQLVEQQRAVDAAKGVEIAKVLEGFVKRKVIKQTIMTTVYGVTRFGARLQIVKQLKDIDDFPAEMVWSASLYLTGRTFDSLRTMFKSTKEIQDWFTECARQISSISMQHIEWVTPMGLPIVQPYFKYKKLPRRHCGTYEPFPVDKYGLPNVMKQKNAFPPNFIHSLDSSHMMLTSLYSEREGITFVSVHDCYWTHPSTVAIMNQICREQFVALHSEPILENLSEFLYKRFSYDNADLEGDGSVMELTKKKLNRKLLQLPKKGDFDINNVLNSVYFFS